MAYKSILTIVTDPQAQAAQIDAAVALARAEDAHLELFSLGIDRTQTGYYYAGATGFVYQEMIEQAQRDVAEVEAALRQRMAAEDIRWSCEAAVAQLGAMSGLIALRARFADLVVQMKPYAKGQPGECEAIVEAAMFEGGAPLLVVPETGLQAIPGQRVVIAWNQSVEALNAVHAALPILKRAAMVNIAVIDPPQHGPERSDPAGLLSQWLSRHGVRAEVSVLAKTMPRISDILARHLRDTDADLLVMGAYGHSRFREAILGGATRNTLEATERPVFMAH
ncbi:universal stress protein [Frigidibacter oleivorans]|uniref:universal stress protein n=1 Tax=Frigidibacter oleivorans TaxID=2487129 RepID=UPI000F8C9365|nr:universal stress protein [Frigidibacter oleivorans]